MKWKFCDKTTHVVFYLYCTLKILPLLAPFQQQLINTWYLYQRKMVSSVYKMLLMV